jgi:uncharacterized OB-fold protein
MLEQISQSKFFEKINQNNSISSDCKKLGEFFLPYTKRCKRQDGCDDWKMNMFEKIK